MAKQFIDIGANLTDDMFQGLYNGSQKHPSDLEHVLARAWDVGLQRIIVTVGQVSDAKRATDVCSLDKRLFMTIGCHPTRCNDFLDNPEEYYQKLCNLIEEQRPKVVAIGECGLDYDRLQFCEKDVQKMYFEKQLELSEKYELPLFLHCRNSHEDFIDILKRNIHKIPRSGVVHSFDGTLEQANILTEMGFYIGLNGCSLKTKENLDVAAKIPSQHILIETDCPYCGIRPSHAGSSFVTTKFPTVKRKDKWTCDQSIDGRSEPCHIVQVLEVLSQCRGEDKDLLASQIYENTMKLFF